MRVKCETRRQAILDVAAETFFEHGFEQTSMSEITARVGGSKATLYSYFASKEELFVEVVHRLAKRQLDGMFAELEPGQDLRVMLCRFGEQLIEFLSEPRFIGTLRVLYSEAGRSDVGRQFYERGPAVGIRRLAEYFEKCMAQGAMRAGDAQLAARHFIALLRAEIMEPLLMNACSRADLPAAPELVSRAVDVFLCAYAAGAAQAQALARLRQD